MSTDANASAAQVPEIGTDEWVAQALKAKGLQGVETSDAAEQYYEEPQEADTSDADTNAENVAQTPVAVTAPTWREAQIPNEDATVPQHFRGKPVAELYDSYRHMERAWNEQQQRLRELEAKVAAKETLKELLAEQAAQSQPKTPADPYRDAGIDLETDPVLNPTKFFPKQEEVILAKAKMLLADELRKRDDEAQRQAMAKQEEIAIAAALARVEKERGLNEQQMKARIPSMMMSVAERFGREALRDPDKVLAAHDEIFGTPVQVVPATTSVPNPPGVKRPAAVDVPVKPQGPSLKSYEREILAEMQEALNNERPGIKIDPERLVARYAANLKRQRS